MTLSRLTIALLMTTSGTSYAASNIFPVGSNLGYGDASNNNSLFSVSANPAWVGANLHNENNYGFGVTAGGMFRQTELNKVGDSFQDDIKPVIDQIEQTQTSVQALEQLNNLTDVVNNLVLDTKDKFKMDALGTFSIPIVVTNVNYGGFAIELSGLTQGQASMISQDRAISIDSSYVTNNPRQLNESDEDYFSRIVENAIDADAAFYSKVAAYSEAALSYSNQVYANPTGILTVGVKAKLMQARLRKSISDFNAYFQAISDDGNVSSSVSDEINDLTTGNFQTEFGLDLGAMWINPNWYAGLTLQNINSPTFSFNQLGTGSQEKDFIERSYSNQINLNEEVVLAMQGRIEGAVYSESRQWTLGASLDTNETVDLVNNVYQWATINASFASNTGDAWWWALVPDVRLGYRSNLKGDAENFITSGFTFGALNIDLAFAPSTFSEIQNNEAPTGLAANMGLEVYF